ncbi:MAG: Ig-like domain-containing protein [Bacteroidaceae bacterium]|nr:Ig-like domain-containing protein [Bacteroidaceae bacterium]
MKKSNYLWIAALAALIGCSKDSEMTESPVTPIKNNTETVSKQPIQFGAYVNRATTRAGMVGPLTTSTGTDNLQTKGFGVIAYYTDDDQYSPIYAPNFMYNTQVTYNSSAWEYSPVQYWPNETGDNAVSEGVDRLSFFAYAPYVDVITNTGLVTDDDTSGIVGLSRNGAVGDPFVKYYVDLDPAKQVDFCWGVDDDGKPNLNMTKQAVNDKVNFNFNHALAALNVQIDALIDELTPGNNTLDANTKIYVRSVTFEGFVTKGSFNLNTNKATWYNMAGTEYIDGGSVTIYDGRTNGREAQSESASESPVGLNPVIVQSNPYDGSETAGVTNSPVNLFDNATTSATTPAAITAPLYVIPSGQPLTVTIVYDVETKNPKLSTYLSDRETHGTSVENKITKTVSFGTSNKLVAGMQYVLKLHLGMTSVNFDAEVLPWDPAVNGATDLPVNTGTSSGGSVPVTGITLDMSNMKLASNGSYTINPTIIPNNASDPTINWTSDDDNIVSVDANGKVTAVRPGSATITATTLDGGFSESCTVNVVPTTLEALKQFVNAIPSPTDAQIGAYKTLSVDSDGDIEVADTEILDNNKYDSSKKIGFIAYVSTSNVDTSVDGSRILVLADENVPKSPAGSLMRWSALNRNNNHVINNLASVVLDGLSATNDMNDDSFEAKIALVAWATGMIRPTNSSDWFMPSIGQWKVINDWIGVSLLGTYRYLSSSESNYDPGYSIWVFNTFTSETRYDDTFSKQDTQDGLIMGTRAVFAY